MLDAIAADLVQAAPDHVALTGDLTNFSTAPEVEAAAAWLRGLGDPASVTVSPGNHDALTGSSEPERFAAWRDWLGDVEELRFPMMRRRGPLAIFNLCSAVPTALHKAGGRLGTQQIERLAGGLREAERQGLTRVVLLHHPITRGVVAGRAELSDRSELTDALREAGAELVLHGHAHKAAVSSTPGPKRSIPVLGVPSASAMPGHGEGARYHIIEFGPGGIGVTARGIGADGIVVDAGRYTLVQG